MPFLCCPKPCPCAGGTLPGPPRLAAELRHGGAGRGLRVFTTAPGLQLYSGNFLGGVPGKGGLCYGPRQSVCLESQTYPNSVNEPRFPSPWVLPGEVYRHVMRFEFFTFEQQ